MQVRSIDLGDDQAHDGLPFNHPRISMSDLMADNALAILANRYLPVLRPDILEADQQHHHASVRIAPYVCALS